VKFSQRCYKKQAALHAIRSLSLPKAILQKAHLFNQILKSISSPNSWQDRLVGAQAALFSAKLVSKKCGNYTFYVWSPKLTACAALWRIFFIK
jgi:hypothetical protein